MKKQLLSLRESLTAFLSDDRIEDSLRQNLFNAISLIDEILKRKWVSIGPVKIEIPTEFSLDDVKFFLIQMINILMNLKD